MYKCTVPSKPSCCMCMHTHTDRSAHTKYEEALLTFITITQFVFEVPGLILDGSSGNTWAVVTLGGKPKAVLLTSPAVSFATHTFPLQLAGAEVRLCAYTHLYTHTTLSEGAGNS